MGIVIKQSIRNTLTTYFGFGIGAVNALFLYTLILGETYYGITAFVLSSSGILMPLMALGAHNTIVKFYPHGETAKKQSGFLTAMLFLPLLFFLPLGLIFYLKYTEIALWLSRENPMLLDFIWLLPVLGILMSYFEIYYAWVKVHFQSVFGSFLKEVFLRFLVSVSLLMVYYEIITAVFFVFSLVLIYGLNTSVMMLTAFWIKKPSFKLYLPDKLISILTYSFFILISGSIAALLVDIDRFMISQFVQIENVAYYSVAVFIAAVIAVPGRAMHQITYPLTAKLMAQQNFLELNKLYKQTSINLQFVGGFIFLGILVNLHQIYELIPAQYSGGIPIVFLIGFSKYFELVLGNNNAIIFNSNYYRIVLAISIFLILTTIGLNIWLIPALGIEGAAIATLLSMLAYSILKLYFVVRKIKLFPFTQNTVKLFLFSLFLFGLLYYWDFPFHPTVNIFLKSTLTTLLYVGVAYLFKISVEINQLIEKYVRLVFK
ncbi:MAG: polysaccharide biosynthesis C-terminal domain-containing protein [Bacteroidetes bacterium]|nr:polysaccharide biosynthesis C-terminal domain-containing protein [Bacteroidota bacterium]